MVDGQVGGRPGREVLLRRQRDVQAVLVGCVPPRRTRIALCGREEEDQGHREEERNGCGPTSRSGHG